MKKIKISPTLLNEWASLLNGDYEKWNKDEQSIRDYILGDYEPNYATSKGNAVHEMVQNGVAEYYSHTEGEEIITADHWSLPGVLVIPDKSYYKVHDSGFNKDWIFTDKAVRAIDEVHQKVKGSVFEAWGGYELYIKGFHVRMNMRFDCLRGIIMHELKSSKSAKKYGDYWHSYQLKSYFLGCPDINTIIYHAIQVPDENKSGVIAWARHQEFVYHRTGAEEEEVRSMMSGLIDFITDDPKLLERLTIK